jgi:phosphate uptake regulator
MTELINQAIEAIAKLQPATQDDLARLMLALVRDAPVPLTASEAEAIAEAEQQIARGEGIPSEVMEAFWHANGV